MERTNISQCRDCTQDIVKHLVDQLIQLLGLLQKGLENCSPSHEFQACLIQKTPGPPSPRQSTNAGSVAQYWHFRRSDVMS